MSIGRGGRRLAGVALGVEHVGVVERALVAVAGGPHQLDEGALGHLDTADRRVPGGDPEDAPHRRFEAQDLLDEGGQSVGLGTQAALELWPFAEQPQPAGDRLAGGLLAAPRKSISSPRTVWSSSPSPPAVCAATRLDTMSSLGWLRRAAMNEGEELTDAHVALRRRS